jgi:hypothetical protein
MPTLPELMPELDQLMSALFLVALLLYLIATAMLVTAIGAAWYARDWWAVGRPPSQSDHGRNDPGQRTQIPSTRLGKSGMSRLSTGHH